MTEPRKWTQEEIDAHMFVEEDDELEEDREADCGRWDNGRLVFQCRLAGTEWCDWECPIGLPHTRPERE